MRIDDICPRVPVPRESKTRGNKPREGNTVKEREAFAPAREYLGPAEELVDIRRPTGLGPCLDPRRLLAD